MHRWLVWNLVFPVHELVKRHSTLRILREMEATDSLTVSELEQFRTAKLSQFLQYAYAHVPYVQRMMQQAGVGVSDIHGPADLVRLPVMRKADVREHRLEMRSQVAGKLTSFSTGGSTGQPLLFDLPEERISS